MAASNDGNPGAKRSAGAESSAAVMPYIPLGDRAEIGLHERQPGNAGELNFSITAECLDYIKRRGIRYATINEVIGVLECVKQEFYRRLAAPYENLKMGENGDVYP